MKQELLRSLPSVDGLLQDKRLQKLISVYGRESVIQAARQILSDLREAILKDKAAASELDQSSTEQILEEIENHLKIKNTPSLKKSINATGVILHTGLGRAVMPPEAVEAVHDVITGYSSLAVDIESGRRGHRDTHLENLICELTGAEAATVVNNNAAATMLILNTLAQGKEVILSRGQLVEIGGSFRMPDVMAASGAILHEVGTTNKTHLKDYAAAINEETGALMRAHHSNYRILGFFSEPGIAELAELAHHHNLPLIDDLGSGALVDLHTFGLENEPLVRESLKDGADIICFSGDKLIGGPQAGLIVGRRDIIERIRKNPLSRAFRIGKMTIAAMEATLKLFLRPDQLTERHPVYRMFAEPLPALNRRALQLQRRLRVSVPEGVAISVIDGRSQIGSGSAPVETLPTRILRVLSETETADTLAGKLRASSPPVFCRVQKDALLFDMRTIHPKEDSIILQALTDVLN
ncbi:MAG: L-seryl-tRNA(Sec) selenium transferase [Candidatus Aminicenantes bacterium]|nr:L-seryl-tRNA(Sec) selenium transferase [Candidatus Aminicenantes bacterium]